jgi:hypothetical protein
MISSVETLLTRFFPSNLKPWFDDGASGWDSISLGFDNALEDTVSGWDHDGFDHFPIWLNRELAAVLFHDPGSGPFTPLFYPRGGRLQGKPLRGALIAQPCQPAFLPSGLRGL